jgi:hypothetical protein
MQVPKKERLVKEDRPNGVPGFIRASLCLSERGARIEERTRSWKTRCSKLHHCRIFRRGGGFIYPFPLFSCRTPTPSSPLP